MLFCASGPGAGLVETVDASGTGLLAQIPGLQGVEPAVLDEMGAALAEFKVHLMADALLTDVQHPVVVEGAGVSVGFAPDQDAFNARQIRLQTDPLQQGLGGDAPVPD